LVLAAFFLMNTGFQPMKLSRLFGLVALVLAGSVQAQDARRGAELYMQLPSGVASCVSCHGPEPQGNRNSLLKAANNPQALTKALATVGVMSYIRASLDDAGINDLAAFLGAVNVASSADTALLLFPLTADFGTLGLGAASGPQRFVLFNRGTVPIGLSGLSVRSADNSNGYSLSHQCPSSLASGASCTASITFVGSAVGQLAGTLQVSSSATAKPLVGALAAKVNAGAVGELGWAPDSQALEFGSGSSASATSARVLTLVNGGLTPVTLGAAPLVIGSVTITGQNTTPFSVSGCAAGLVLQPSGKCELTVRYAPGGPAPSQAVLQIRSNGKNPPSLQLNTAGEPAPVMPPTLPTSPPTPDAGSGGGAMTIYPSSLLWLYGVAAAALALRRSSWGRAR
jgi:cytochrome c553